MLREFAARYFPQATGPTMTLKMCMFTNAPDGHFIVDLHPEYPQVSFASACSGHGFKFASVIGEILADLAQRRNSRHDISLFALSRFGGQMSVLHRDKVELIERGLPVPIRTTPSRRVPHGTLPAQGVNQRPPPLEAAGRRSHILVARRRPEGPQGHRVRVLKIRRTRKTKRRERKNSMRTHARVVIVGAGIAGCSAAYHLAQMGWTDILVLDKGPLFETGGSTTHAAGLIFQTNYSKMMTEFAKYTVNLLKPLHYAGEQCVYQVGGIEVAATPARWEELKRKQGVALSYGLEGHLLSPAEVKQHIPILDEKVILGGYYVPTDADVRGWHCAAALAEAAMPTPASSFVGNVAVSGHHRPQRPSARPW